MRVLESRQITVLTTNTCTAACSHCCMNSGPERKGRLTFAQIRGWIDEIASRTEIRTIIFAGGEPLLLGPDIFAAISHARSRRLSTRLVTNAYWALNDARARDICQKLVDAGLDELNISIDDFHLPYVDPLNVRRAFQAARTMDFQSVVVVHCTGPTTTFNDEQLDALLGEQLPRLFDGERERTLFDTPGRRPFVCISNTSLQAVGRASQCLSSSDIEMDERWERRSREIGGCPWAVRSPAITPDGHLVSCCGFEVRGNEVLDIGDLAGRSLTELLDQADGDLPLNWIALEGPYAIMDFLKSRDPALPFHQRYGSYCELCQHIVTDPAIRKALFDNMDRRVFHILQRREDIKAALEQEAAVEDWLSEPATELQPAGLVPERQTTVTGGHAHG